MLLPVWYDSKVVYLLSNTGDNNFAEIQRKKKIKEHELSPNTQTISEFQHNMSKNHQTLFPDIPWG